MRVNILYMLKDNSITGGKYTEYTSYVYGFASCLQYVVPSFQFQL